ncbi:5'-methylthioadenosine/adenosylhomocysteine nucleosidase [Caldisalinibacter kiritimatiensis]|uniref:adenosylhomocysteine nucleosidase n=1 Tax=Caldisalinibacter kiritimatiensis TaxID=1304284 RepID=R1CRI8_9FIRM|nr:5'-methylthioadenosine/adenosylhomocysteine nucleosidase [Caldisalinibacter kiritimatiensis]EOD01291.1 5'-methylthioadenosine nucleosidase / S-adenosylhomocysteine nucleosidase [Caldisalinibacter kiritimatiensis]
MNKIGIIGAMDEEIEIIKDKMTIDKIQQVAGMEFYLGKLEDREVVLVRCGIGKVNAAVCTQILISKFSVSMVINTGVAGAIYDELNIGDIVISKDVIQHDFDATAFGYKLGEIPRLDEYIFKGDERLIEITKQVTKEQLKGHKAFVGRILSGDVFVASAEKKDSLWKNFEGYCAEMEGAAIGHTCYLNNIPFVILRAMSDKADGSAHVNFNEFVHKAARNSANIVQEIVKLI